MINKKICYWSVAWGNHSYMLQSLVDSFHEFNIEGDFLVFSDLEIKGAVNRPLSKDISLDLSNYLFKFDYLKLLKKETDYDYFIFIDADSLFLKKPERDPLFFMQNQNPWFCFLESPINSKKTTRGDWWNVPNEALVYIFREMGVVTEEIRNLNAGYWICHKNFIDQAYSLGMECFEMFKKFGFNVTEEIPMSYITNYIMLEPRFAFHENYFDYWASDWTGEFKDNVPTYSEWTNTSYMTGERTIISPCLIHAMRSKSALIELGKNSTEKDAGF